MEMQKTNSKPKEVIHKILSQKGGGVYEINVPADLVKQATIEQF